MKGLWRAHPRTKVARHKLLLQAMEMWRVQVFLLDTNWSSLRDDSDEEKPYKKLWISNIPISVHDREIERSRVL